MQGCINGAGSNCIHTDTLFCIFDGEAACNCINAAFGNHWDRSAYTRNGVVGERGRDADDAAAGSLQKHPLDRDLSYINETPKIGRNQPIEVLGRVIGKGLGEEYTCIIYQYINGAESGDSCFDDSCGSSG